MAATEIVIKGLEAVRTDWTALAREVQRELVTPRLLGRAVGRMAARGARRACSLASSTTSSSTRSGCVEGSTTTPRRAQAPRRTCRPPRQLEAAGREVSYVITLRGPEPLEKRTAPIDYEHYLEKQLAAAVDSILPVLGTSFERVAGSQLPLF